MCLAYDGVCKGFSGVHLSFGRVPRERYSSLFLRARDFWVPSLWRADLARDLSLLFARYSRSPDMGADFWTLL